MAIESRRLVEAPPAPPSSTRSPDDSVRASDAAAPVVPLSRGGRRSPDARTHEELRVGIFKSDKCPNHAKMRWVWAGKGDRLPRNARATARFRRRQARQLWACRWRWQAGVMHVHWRGPRRGGAGTGSDRTGSGSAGAVSVLGASRHLQGEGDTVPHERALLRMDPRWGGRGLLRLASR